MIRANIEEYDSYKDSDIDWVEKLPSDWGVKRLKEILYEVVYGTSEKTKEIGKYEVLGMGDIDEGKVSFPKKRFIDGVAKELLLKRGDLLFNRTNSLALVGKVGLIEEDLEDITFASYLIRLRVKNNQLSRYFWYFLNSEYFIAYSRANAIQTANQANLSSSKLKQFKIIHIPLRLQEAIAHYLDTKTAQINRKIDLLTQKATLYGNLKQSLINETVTRGLDKSVPMKDSGIEWLGEVPEHWETHTVKRVAKVGYKNFVDGDWIESPFITDKGIRLIQTGNVGIGIYKEKGWRYISEKTFNDLNCTEIFPGDVLICRLDGPVGRACLVPDIQVRMITSVDNTILKPSKDFDSKFIVYVMSSSLWLDWTQALCRVGGGFRFRISRSMLGELRIQKPPISEQKAIADYLDTKTAQIDQIIQTINTQIEKLKELRKTLINDVVTGKIRVIDNE